MDGRIALAPGATLKLETATGYTLYTIRSEVGRGGSCIVYDASYTDNLGNFKLVRIKECYPHALWITRTADGILGAEARDTDAFAAAKEHLRDAYQRNHDLFTISRLTNTVANTSDIYEANGTVYIVSVYMNGKTFAEYHGETLHDCLSLLIGAAKALQRIHDAGYLYLDLKPDNILTLEGSLDLVQLFDFDSMISMEELAEAIQANDTSGLRTSYTKGYASLEQQTGKLRQLGRHSDLYSLGAVLFYALWHKTPSAFDCDPEADYDYDSMSYAGHSYQDKLFRALTRFFRKTLASYYADRYQDVEEAIQQLTEILTLSDSTRPCVYSSPIRRNAVFYGRQDEIQQLADLLNQAKNGTASLYGMGGIGKSTLTRQYAVEHSEDWDAVIWLYDQGDLSQSIADDTLVQVNTVHPMKEESSEEYLHRKTQTLSALAAEQRILLVLDNFDSNHLEELEPFQNIGWTVLLISRERMPEGMFPSLQIEELNVDDLALLFQHYSHCNLEDESDISAFETIVSCMNGHTLLTELIARQISKSYLNMQAAEAIVAGIGLSDLPKEKIDYIHDQSAWNDTLLKILDRLVEIDDFSEEGKAYMKLLSLFAMPGIEATLFKSLTELETLDLINDLESSGWVKSEGSQIYLHPVMLEYVRTWSWTDAAMTTADRMMRNLYEHIRPAGNRHDIGRQFPSDYEGLYRYLRIIPQIIDNIDFVSEASQQLLYRWLMDAPVDQDTPALFRMLELLENPRYLDDDSILRLYETAAYYRARLYVPDDAIEILNDMRKYLLKHPSAYYLAAYHKAMGVILHNNSHDLKLILHHEDKAIVAARLPSSHPDARKQLASCLLNKARTLMSERIRQDQVRKLIQEAESIISQYTEPLDYERYQFACDAAMCYAMDGEKKTAQSMMDAADAIVYASPDSDLSVAEHLIEEVAPFQMEMQQFDLAEDAVQKAISLCEKHTEALRYRETIFDAYRFLGLIFSMDSKYIQSEEAYNEAEKRVNDWPYECKLPLCPEGVRKKAASLRSAKEADQTSSGTGGNRREYEYECPKHPG